MDGGETVSTWLVQAPIPVSSQLGTFVLYKVALVGPANMAQCGGSKRTFYLVVAINNLRYSWVEDYAL